MNVVKTRQGNVVKVHSFGAGPGVAVVHGGGVTIEVYRRLAARLADRFSVHLYNRRGRGDAVARSGEYQVQDDIDDLAAVLEHTGSNRVIGHSVGGFIALEAARQLPIDKLAIYDPAVMVDGLFPTPWLEEARDRARRGDVLGSLVVTSAGLNPQLPAARLPQGVQRAFLRAFVRTPIGRTMLELLPQTLDEAAAAQACGGSSTRYSDVTADTLLIRGADGPAYYAGILAALEQAMPRVRTMVAPRSGHDAINRANPRLVTPLAEFFAAPNP